MKFQQLFVLRWNILLVNYAHQRNFFPLIVMQWLFQTLTNPARVIPVQHSWFRKTWNPGMTF